MAAPARDDPWSRPLRGRVAAQGRPDRKPPVGGTRSRRPLEPSASRRRACAGWRDQVVRGRNSRLRESDRAGRYGDRRSVTTVPDIPVVQLPAIEADAVVQEGVRISPGSIWAVDIPHARRITPVTLVALGVSAGIAAMALGVAAILLAGSASSPSARPSVPPANASSAPPSQASAASPAVERRALALLAKTSTERIAFRGAPGLVLAVGSGGRAAILIRGLAKTPAGTPYNAWIVTRRSRGAPVRAARFMARERAVFLGTRLGPNMSVVVSTGRPVAGPPAANRVVAVRG